MTTERVVVSALVHAELCAAAAAAWPAEIAGLLGGAGTAGQLTIDTFVACPAGDEHGFAIDAAHFARAEAGLRDAGRAFVGFVHSHPRGTCHLSAADIAAAWPGSLQLVLGGVHAGDLRLAAFRVRDAIAVPLPLRLAAGEARGAAR